MTQQTITFILEFIFLQFLTTLIHELGHFFALKFYHVEVNEIRVFTKPLFWIFPIKDRFYSIGWIPFGGATFYNKLAYYHLKLAQKINIILAGVVLNFLTAHVSFIFYYYTGHEILFFFYLLNMFKIFNLIPWPGSDGEKLLTLYRLKNGTNKHN